MWTRPHHQLGYRILKSWYESKTKLYGSEGRGGADTADMKLRAHEEVKENLDQTRDLQQKLRLCSFGYSRMRTC